LLHWAREEETSIPQLNFGRTASDERTAAVA
jgi:hypothetical protein